MRLNGREIRGAWEPGVLRATTGVCLRRSGKQEERSGENPSYGFNHNPIEMFGRVIRALPRDSGRDGQIRTADLSLRGEHCLHSAHNGSRLCALEPTPFISSGRDGQIRTADLSLRRRPDHPSIAHNGFACALLTRLRILRGRDGQIRTADLSLRRRPLYPSELRPRTEQSFDCSRTPAFQAFLRDVAAVVHSVEVDLLDGRVGVGGRRGEIGAGSGHAEHAAAGGFEALRTHASCRLGTLARPQSVDSGDRDRRFGPARDSRPRPAPRTPTAPVSSAA